MGAKSGDACGGCRGGRLGVYATCEREGIYTRYLKCDQCKCTYKEVVRSCEVRRRRPRVSQSADSTLAIRLQLKPKTKFDVLRRGNFSCVYCGRKAPDVQLHVDHVVPISCGGTNAIENLVSACSECNVGKGARTA